MSNSEQLRERLNRFMEDKTKREIESVIEITKRLKQNEQKFFELNNILKSKNSEISILENDKNSLYEEITKYKGEIFELTEKVNNRDKLFNDAQIKEKEEQLFKLEKEVTALKDETIKLKNLNDEMFNQLSDVSEEKDTLLKSNTQLSEKLNLYCDEIVENNNNMSNIKKDTIKHNKLIKEKDSVIQKLEKEIETLKESISLKDKQLTEFMKDTKIKDLEKQYETQLKEKDDEIKKIKNLLSNSGISTNKVKLDNGASEEDKKTIAEKFERKKR